MTAPPILSSLEFFPPSGERGCFFVLLLWFPVCGTYCRDCSVAQHVLARLVVCYCSHSTSLYMFYFQNFASCQPLHPRILVTIPGTPVFHVLLMDARLHLGSVSVFHHVPVTPPQVSHNQLYLLRFLLDLLSGSRGQEKQPTAPQRPPAQSRVLEGNWYFHCYHNINHFPRRIRASASSPPVLAADSCPTPYVFLSCGRHSSAPPRYVWCRVWWSCVLYSSLPSRFTQPRLLY